ncbi:MAG: bifunctional oligoribonuclease/PAP phosphatase NrnA [candidate division Zixibacteria bacterium]|nr:bifunctional oligoribonuclease/PAP phosphatase NrnA [candidate division Zixibacteria bacterium]
MVKAASRVVLATHAEPDGDAVGSVLGFVHALRALGRGAVAWPLNSPPRRYGFLPGFEELAASELPGLREGDVVVALDSADAGRLPAPVAAFARDGLVVNVDHHAAGHGFGTLNWVEPNAPAAAAMVWVVLRELAEEWPPETALCLYVGLVADTGNFTYSNTNAWAFDMAADLVARGVSPAEVERELYRRYPVSYMNVLGAALGTLERRGGVVSMTVTADALARAGARVEDTEGLVDFTRSVDGCHVGVLFRELEGGVRISFRAAEELDVSELAVAHGGGGHAAAAGCFVEGRLEDVRRSVLAEVEEWLRLQ